MSEGVRAEVSNLGSSGRRLQLLTGVGLLKFDNLDPICYSSKHDHLPGLYSMEAIGNAILMNGVNKQFETKAQLAGYPMTCKPVVGKNELFPGCWQAWRIAVVAEARPLPFALSITQQVKANVHLIAKAHFVRRWSLRNRLRRCREADRQP